MSTTADLDRRAEAGTEIGRHDLCRPGGAAGHGGVQRQAHAGQGRHGRCRGIDAICRVLKIDFADLARRVADAQPLLKELTQEQEKAVVADKKLLLCAICVLSQWTLEQITA
jgi:hypothetical protein